MEEILRNINEKNINIAVNICTYEREEYIKQNIERLLESKFFEENSIEYYGHMHIFVTDNGGSLEIIDEEYLHISHNRNTGGSGGFQKGIESIRAHSSEFSHVVFMDDDVDFEMDCFYKLYDFLCIVPEEHADRPIAGRMILKENPNIQHTAAEIWNGGQIEHIGFHKSIDDILLEPDVEYYSGAEYGGWWFCCFPYSFVKYNDIVPFFLHCDDVEYGLRCGKSPIILKDVKVWHEAFEGRMTPAILYYDTRNPLFVNKIHGINQDKDMIIINWIKRISSFHAKQDWDSEYACILGMRDYLRGLKWLYRIDPQKHHAKIQKIKSDKLKNMIAWRLVWLIFRISLLQKCVKKRI